MKQLSAVALAIVVAGCLGPGDVASVLPEVPEVDAAATVASLREFTSQHPNRRSNSADHVAARDWLADEFSAAGLDVWRQPFSDGIEQENIVGIQWGRARDQWVVVASHYDSLVWDCYAENAADAPAPDDSLCQSQAVSEGAYDNGSGTAMVVEMAKAYAGLVPPVTIAWVAFDGEERGTQGSSAFAAAALGGEVPGLFGSVDLLGMVDVDMIGLNWPGVDAPIYFHHTSPSVGAWVMQEARERGVPDGAIKERKPTVSSSDYAVFEDVGVPVAYFVSNFEEFQAPYDAPVTTPTGAYPFWHFADTWDTMVAMAGSEYDVALGFETALALTSDAVFWFAWHAASE